MPELLRVAILVPTPDYDEDWRPAFARKQAALNRAGMAVEPRVWTDPCDLAHFDLVLPLFAWGYQRSPGCWFALLDRLEQEALRVINPVLLLRWNSDKAYLAELSAKGVAAVPTVDVPALDAISLAGAREILGVDDVVVKPPVSGGADGTCRIAAGGNLPVDALGARRLVQPMMPAILSDGEYSLIYFGGRFSHAIVKRPASGDFRVQERFGGRDRPWQADAESRRLAEMALAAAPSMPVYARVDMVADAAGRLHVMELELIEPSLFLHHAPDGGAAFGQAISAAI